MFGNDDEDDSRSLTDQLLDIKSKNIKVEHSEKGKHSFIYFLSQYHTNIN